MTKGAHNLQAGFSYEHIGNTYLEADQIVDHVAADPNGIGYVRFHQHFPPNIKILDLARTAQGPFVHYSMEWCRTTAIRSGRGNPSGSTANLASRWTPSCVSLCGLC